MRVLPVASVVLVLCSVTEPRISWIAASVVSSPVAKYGISSVMHADGLRQLPRHVTERVRARVRGVSSHVNPVHRRARGRAQVPREARARAGIAV